MSAFAGVWHWTGTPVQEAAWGMLVKYNRIPGVRSHSSSMRRVPELAMHCQVLDFDRWSRTERQPYPGADGTVLTWNGRLDNREDLIISLHHHLTADLSDAALVAAAYSRWGLDCLERLLGEWNLAIWDAQERKVILAQDYMGNLPLYYLVTNDGISWATRLSALVAAGNLYTALDERYIAAALVHRAPTTMTPFANTHLLGAGRVLTASSHGNVEVRRWWYLRPAALQGCDYAEQARALMTEAVRVRLRAEGTVWAELSGGWDSSAVVCLAFALIRRGLVEASRLQTVSMVTSTTEDDPEVTPLVASVERWCQFKTFWVEHCYFQTFETLLKRYHFFPVPVDLLDLSTVQPVGHGILLTGVNGDFTMPRAGSAAAVFEILHAGHPWRAFRFHCQYARDKKRPLVRSFVRHAHFRYCREWYVHKALRTMEAQNRAWRAAAVTAGVHRRLVACAPDVGLPLDSRSLRLADFPITKRSRVAQLYALQGSEVAAAERHPAVWRTNPYMHRPLIEFVLSMPEDFSWKPGEYRPLMRRALTDVLPPELLRNARSGTGSAVWTHRRMRQAALLAKEHGLMGPAGQWELVRRDYVDGQSLTTALEDLRVRGIATPVLRQWFPLEAWLRTLPMLAQAFSNDAASHSDLLESSPERR